MAPNNSEALSVAVDGIVDSIRKLNTSIWQFNLTYQDITLAAGTKEYTLAAAFRAPRHCELLNASNVPVSRLHWQDPKTFNIGFEDRSASGDPNYYTVFNIHDTGYLDFDCPPTSGFVGSYPTARIRYYASLQYLTNDSDTIGGPSELEGYIVWHAKGYISSIYDPGKTQYAEIKANEMWGLLKRQNVKNQLTDWPDE